MKIILFKLKQFAQLLRAIPLVYLLLLALLAFALGAFLFVNLKQAPNSRFVLAGYAIVLLWIHLIRKDTLFVSSIYRKPFLIFWGEYSLFSLPFLGLLIAAGQYTFIPLWIVVNGLIACIPYGVSPIKKTYYSFRRLFPQSVEWIAGMRRYTLPFAVLLLLALLLVVKPYASFAFLFLLLILSCSFYGENESTQLLGLEEQKASAFLWKKIRIAYLYFLKCTAYVPIIYLLFHPDQGWLLLGYLLLSFIAFTLFVTYKYAYYIPNQLIDSGGTILAIGFIGILIPVFLPVTLLLILRFLPKAHDNLKNYLHAYN